MASNARDGRDDGRGRDAARPQHIPTPGWKDIAMRSWREVSENNIFLVAGGVTYAVLLALFPGLAALVSLYGLAFDPAQIEQQVNALSGVLPQQGLDVLAGQLHGLVTAPHSTLGFGAVAGLVLALWSASRGVSGLISALNIAYEQKESRGFFKFNLIALGLTLCLIVGGLIVIALVAVLPAVVQLISLGPVTKWIVLILEWPLLLGVLLVGMAALYRYAPDRDEPRWLWVTPGAIVAAALWVLGSIGFSLYVGNFGSYDKTYGSLGGVVVLLTWLYLSSLVVLLGAVVNAQAERQTERDTTRGQEKPLGRRGAYAADTVGRST